MQLPASEPKTVEYATHMGDPNGVSGFVLVQSWRLQSFAEWTNRCKSCLTLPFKRIFFQVHGKTKLELFLWCVKLLKFMHCLMIYILHELFEVAHVTHTILHFAFSLSSMTLGKF